MKLLTAIVLLVLALLLAWTLLPGDPPPVESLDRTDPGVVAPGSGARLAPLHEPRAGGSRDTAEAGQARTEAALSEADAADGLDAPGILLTVIDHDRMPIAGASVRTFDDSVEGRATTNEAGECALPVAPSGASMRLEIDAEGHFHVRAYYRRTDSLTIRLPRAIAMTGRVLEAGPETPIPDARVELVHAFCKHCEPERTTTDEHGVYHLATVPVARDSYFAVSATGYPTDAFSFALPEDAEEGFQHDFRLQSGIVVDGQVVDFATGAPIASAAIRDAGRGTLMANTDAAGRFSARFLPGGYDGEIEIGISSKEHCQARIAFDPKQLEFGGPFPIRLPRGTHIEGVVRDAQGRPVAEARVRVREDVGWNARSRARGEVAPTPLDELPSGLRLTPVGFATEVRTDAEGRFWTGGFVPWTPRFTVDVEHPSSGTRRIDVGPLAGPGETTWVEIALDPQPHGGSIHGRMLLNGEPIGGSVNWRGATRSGWFVVPEGGAFRLSDVEAGEVWLRADPERRGELDYGQLFTGRPELLQVTAGEQLDHDIVLELPMTTIAGRVTGPAEIFESPPTIVAVAAGSRCRAVAECDANGAYSVEVPDDADLYYVAVSIGDLTRSHEGVLAGASGVDFTFPVLGRVRYKVVDAETGELIENCDMAWTGSDGKRSDLGAEHWRTRSPDGWIDLALPVGLVALHASKDPRGYLPKTVRDIQVTSGGAGTKVTIELEQGLELALVLADGQGPPPAEHRLYLLEEHAWDEVHISHTENGWECDCGEAYEGAACLRRLVHFEAGRAELKGLPAGPYRFKSFPPGIQVEPERLEVTGTETEAIAVTWTVD